MPRKRTNKFKENEDPLNFNRSLYTKTDSNAGAHSKFDKVSEEIIFRTREGSSVKDRIAGLIHNATYREWVNAGEEDLINNINSKYSEFSTKLKEAENEYRTELRLLIKDHADNDWKAASWLLERSDPETYKLKDKVEMKQDVEISQKALLEIPDNGRRE